MTSFQEIFGEIAPMAVGAGWNFLDRQDAVDLMWIYLSSSGDGAYTINMYAQVDGEILDHHAAAQRVGADSSIEAQTSMHEELDAVIDVFHEGSRAVELPTRMILRFRPSDADLHAEFHHDDLFAGTPEDEQPALSVLEREWFARLQAAGDDSAQP